MRRAPWALAGRGLCSQVAGLLQRMREEKDLKEVACAEFGIWRSSQPISHFSLRSHPVSPSAACSTWGPAAKLHPGFKVIGFKQLSLSPHGSVERPAGPGPGAATPARTWAVRLPPDPLPSAGSCYPALATRLGRLLSELMFLVFISELTVSRGDLHMAHLPLRLPCKGQRKITTEEFQLQCSHVRQTTGYHPTSPC